MNVYATLTNKLTWYIHILIMMLDLESIYIPQHIDIVFFCLSQLSIQWNGQELRTSMAPARHPWMATLLSDGDVFCKTTTLSLHSNADPSINPTPIPLLSTSPYHLPSPPPYHTQLHSLPSLSPLTNINTHILILLSRQYRDLQDEIRCWATIN